MGDKIGVVSAKTSGSCDEAITKNIAHLVIVFMHISCKPITYLFVITSFVNDWAARKMLVHCSCDRYGNRFLLNLVAFFHLQVIILYINIILCQHDKKIEFKQGSRD